MIAYRRSAAISLICSAVIYGFLSWKVRPIADDYCAAAKIGSEGFIGYLREMRQSWSGDTTQIFLIASLVGWPLTHLPIWIIGFTTLFLFMVVLLICGNTLVHKFLTPAGTILKARSIWVSMSAILMVSWGAYWSIPSWISLNEKYQPAFNSKEGFGAVFGWPIAIVAYLIVPTIIGLLLLIPQRKLIPTLVGLSLTGLIIGTSGYALAVAIMSASLVFQIFPSLRCNPIKLVFFQFGNLAGILMSFFSPGAQARAGILREIAPSVDFQILTRWILVSGAEFLGSVFNLGVVATILVGFGSAKYFTIAFNLMVDKSVCLKFLYAGTIFLIIYYVVISFSELFTYPAFWHLITFKSLVFLYSYLAGFYLAGTECFSVFGKTFFRRESFALLLVIFLALTTISFAKESAVIVERADLWENGSAPLPGISDIYPTGGWVDVCWQDLRRLKDLQDRT